MSHVMTAAVVRRVSRFAMVVVLAPAFVAVSGCLSIGGKTTQVVSSPELDARINSLESRISVLEQAVGTRPAGPTSYVPISSSSTTPSRTGAAIEPAPDLQAKTYIAPGR